MIKLHRKPMLNLTVDTLLYVILVKNQIWPGKIIKNYSLYILNTCICSVIR